VKLVALETLRPAVQPNLLLLRLHADDGAAGLGEAFFGAAAVEAYLHDTVAPVLAGATGPTPEGAARLLAPYVGYQGPGYVRASSRQVSENWGLAAGGRGRFEDLEAFLHRPGELARELWAEGLRGMKVWPFDQAAERTGGTEIAQADLDQGLAVVEAIREAAGSGMDLMVELHGLWNRPAATRILRALAPYRPAWVEDPLRPDAVDALDRLAADAEVPIATGETCVGRRGFLPLLERGAVGVVTVDVGWTGGLTEARKVATLADAYGVPVAPHDCTGPVALGELTWPTRAWSWPQNPASPSPSTPPSPAHHPRRRYACSPAGPPHRRPTPTRRRYLPNDATPRKRTAMTGAAPSPGPAAPRLPSQTDRLAQLPVEAARVISTTSARRTPRRTRWPGCSATRPSRCRSGPSWPLLSSGKTSRPRSGIWTCPNRCPTCGPGATGRRATPR
jgi:galactonate dehydratase